MNSTVATDNCLHIPTRRLRYFLRTLKILYPLVLATALLLIVICAAIDQRYKRVPPHYQPTIVGLGAIVILLAFGYNCGAPLNPARDLGPRIFTLLAGWGTETFTFRKHLWFWVPFLGPHIGALLGVW
ncbi:Aquaporin-10, partial [Araneus ventricosus]